MGKSAEVDAWFAGYENPMKDVMQRAREIILAADPRMDECIKWKSPTFTYQGNLASFNPRSKAHVSLLFHTGAQIPGTHRGLEGGADTARYMQFKDAADVEKQKGALEAVVRAWCAWKAPKK